MKKYIKAYATRVEDTSYFKDDVKHYVDVALEWMFTTKKDEIKQKFYKLDRFRGKDYSDKVAKACNKQIKKKANVDYDFYVRSYTDAVSNRNYIRSSEMDDVVFVDDRFSFDFEDIDPIISLNTSLAKAELYLDDEQVIGNGAGMQYDVIIAVPRSEDHWQMTEDIQHNLDRAVEEAVDGSDYYASVSQVKSTAYPKYANIPDDVYEDSVFYSATIEVVPYQNISPYGEYGIDFGVEDDIESSKKINCATYARNEMASRIKREPTDEEVALVKDAEDYFNYCMEQFRSAIEDFQNAKRSRATQDELDELSSKIDKLNKDRIEAEDKYMDLWNEYMGYSYH